MSELAIITASMQGTLKEIAKQASALGTGLQNAAPGDKLGTPNNSVQYLLAIAETLDQVAEECGKLLNSLSMQKTETKPGI